MSFHSFVSKRLIFLIPHLRTRLFLVGNLGKKVLLCRGPPLRHRRGDLVDSVGDCLASAVLLVGLPGGVAQSPSRLSLRQPHTPGTVVSNV